jgi:NAD(P)-dependent dehydrogenase (short-subunit alcohol dehydrogenase family)
MKSALITGANKGIGLETAKQLLQKGFHVYIGSRNLVATKNEDENLIEVVAHKDAELDLAGIIIYGENKQVDKAVDKFKFNS